eukprot:g2484.t1
MTTTTNTTAVTAKKKSKKNDTISGEVGEKIKTQQQVVDKLQKKCLAVKHETDWTELTSKRLDSEIDRLKSLIKNYRKAIGGNVALDENRSNIARQRVILENRLDLAKKQYTAEFQKARVLRRKINVFRQDNLALKRIGTRESKRLEALRVHRKVVEKELERAQKTLTREKKSLEDLKRKYKIMTLDFQLDMDKYQCSSETSAIVVKRKPPPVRRTRGLLSRSQEEKIRKEIANAKKKKSHRRRKAMENSRFQDLRTNKLLSEKLMKLCKVKSLEELKQKLLETEDRNFALLQQINEIELEIKALNTEIAQRKVDLRTLIARLEKSDRKRSKASGCGGARSQKVDMRLVLERRVEKKQLNIQAAQEAIEKLRERMRLYQDAMKQMYVTVMEGVEDSTKRRPSNMSAASSIVLAEDGSLPTMHDHLPDLDPHFWERMKLSDLSPKLLTQVVDIINIQLMDRVCKHLKTSKSGVSVSEHIASLAKNGPRLSRRDPRSHYMSTKFKSEMFEKKEKMLLEAAQQNEHMSVQRFREESGMLIDIEACRQTMNKLLETMDAEPVRSSDGGKTTTSTEVNCASWTSLLASPPKSQPWVRQNRSGRLRRSRRGTDIASRAIGRSRSGTVEK